MYKDCSGILEKSYKFVIVNDRSLYNPYICKLIECIIRYNLIVGGKIGIMLINGVDNIIDQYDWEIYVDNVDTIRLITDMIYNVKSAHVDSKTTVLSSIVEDNEYMLSINGRLLSKFYILNSYKDMDIFNAIPVLYGQQNVLKEFTSSSDKIRYLPKEIAFMQTYRTLYKITQNLGSVWTNALRTIDMYNNTKKHGGGIPHDILSKFVGPTDIIVGDFALNTMGLLHKPSKLQFISSTHMKDIIIHCNNIMNRKSTKYNAKDKLNYVSHHLPLISDTLFKKYTIRVDSGKYQEYVCDVYNSTTYELVPYVIINGKKIGSPWVLMRFIYVEMWFIRILSFNKKMDLPDRYHDLENQIKLLNTYISSISSTSAGTTKLFPLDYEGVWLNENIIKKKNNRPNNYYPSIAK